MSDMIMSDNLQILVTSDLHGNLPKITTPFDLLLICGDVCPAHDHYYAFQKEWIMNEFADWINSLPLSPDPLQESFCKIVMVGGNHDFFLEMATKSEIDEFYKKTNHRIIILKNEEYDYEYLDENGIDSLKIFGTPYCKIFGSWAFMVTNDTLEKKYSQIPDNIDILISHDSPSLNNLGMIQQGWNKGTDAGNKILDYFIINKKPKFFFSGHIHSGNHNFQKINDTYMANVSYVNERYIPDYEILNFKINKKTKQL